MSPIASHKKLPNDQEFDDKYTCRVVKTVRKYLLGKKSKKIAHGINLPGCDN